MATEAQLANLKTWLEWAGGRLTALPSDHIKPAAYRNYWPDFSNDIYQVLEMRKALSIRALAPSAAEIDLMDKVLILPAQIEDHKRRRVIQMRLLIHPISQRHLRTWTEVAKAEHTSVFKIQSLHALALREIWRRTSDSDLNLISVKFEQISVW